MEIEWKRQPQRLALQAHFERGQARTNGMTRDQAEKKPVPATVWAQIPVLPLS
jgi:hypothetical protein